MVVMEVMEVVMEITTVVMEVVMVQITGMVVVMGVGMVVMVVTLNKLPREAEDNGTRLIRRGESSTIVIHYLAANNIAAFTLGKRWLQAVNFSVNLKKCLNIVIYESYA